MRTSSDINRFFRNYRERMSRQNFGYRVVPRTDRRGIQEPEFRLDFYTFSEPMAVRNVELSKTARANYYVALAALSFGFQGGRA